MSIVRAEVMKKGDGDCHSAATGLPGEKRRTEKQTKEKAKRRSSASPPNVTNRGLDASCLADSVMRLMQGSTCV